MGRFGDTAEEAWYWLAEKTQKEDSLVDSPFDPLKVPLRWHEGGILRVGDSRVSLDIVVGEFEAGAEPRDIARRYPTLLLPDVYAVIAYYLLHRDEVQGYLKARAQEADALRQEIEKHQPPQEELRQRLMERWQALEQNHAATRHG